MKKRVEEEEIEEMMAITIKAIEEVTIVDKEEVKDNIMTEKNLKKKVMKNNNLKNKKETEDKIKVEIEAIEKIVKTGEKEKEVIEIIRETEKELIIEVKDNPIEIKKINLKIMLMLMMKIISLL